MMRDRGGYTPHHKRPHEWRQDDRGELHLWYGMDRGGIVRCFDWDCIRRHTWDRLTGGSDDPTPEMIAAYNLAMDPTGPECIALMPGEVTSL